MRKFGICILLAGSLATASAELRTFKSADGTKTLSASVISVTPAKGAAQIKRSDGKVMNIPVKSLSEDDRAYLADWYKTSMAARRISLRISDEEKKTGEREANNGKITSIDSLFNIDVRNNGETSFEELDLEYQIFYYHDGVDGKKTQHKTAKGQTSISSISSRSDQRIQTEAVKLTKVRPLPASKCVGGT